jgi:hypothetical protein
VHPVACVGGAPVACVWPKLTQVPSHCRRIMKELERGGGFGDGSGTSTTTEHTYTLGTLVVELLNATSNKLVWHARQWERLARNLKRT